MPQSTDQKKFSFKPPMVQGCKYHKRFIPCVLEVLSSKSFVDGLQKCVKQLWGRNKILTHSFNLPEINTYFSCCLIHFILDLSSVQIYLKSLYSSIAGQKWTNETSNWTLNNCMQSFVSQLLLFIYFVMWIFFNL